jgi:hypothetical protein
MCENCSEPPMDGPWLHRNAMHEKKDSLIAKTDITGGWEQINLGYNIVPGYSAEQT